MTAIAAVALLLAAALFLPRLRQQLVSASATRTLTADAILASAAAKLREANIVVEFPNAAGR